MPKKLPKAAKDRAFKLYLTDEFSAKEIADQVNAEQRVVMSEQTIYAWIRQDDWKEKKAETQAKAMEKMQDKQSFNIAKLTEEHFDLYMQASENFIDFDNFNRPLKLWIYYNSVESIPSQRYWHGFVFS